MSAIEIVEVPDLGDFENVGVIEVLVQPGDAVEEGGSLITVESDKATMEIPSSRSGIVREVLVDIGSRVSTGTPIVRLEVVKKAEEAVAPAAGSGAAERPTSRPVEADATPSAAIPPPGASVAPGPRASTPPTRVAAAVMPSPSQNGGEKRPPHASPSVRKYARELGVDVSRVPSSGPKGRILREDVQAYVKGVVQGSGGAPTVATARPDLPPWPEVDYSRFGEIERVELSRLRKISGPNLARNWAIIPHVTNFEDADITDLEEFRKQTNREMEASGVKATMLAFLVKACAATLQHFPEFNASLDGEHLVLKHYYHIGFAVDTPHGLVVPVIRDADRKGIVQIATEMAEIAARAREGKLRADEMQGGTFSISSLGGIGGTGFTPIINAPEVAILGAVRAAMRPVWNGESFEPRLILPLSLSWDHRAVDGAAAARFLAHLSRILGDFRRVLL